MQDQDSSFIARTCNAYAWDEGVRELSKIKDINQKMLLKLLKIKNWTVYDN